MRKTRKEWAGGRGDAEGTIQLPQARAVRNSVRRGPKGSTLITNRRKCKTRDKTLCHFFATDMPFNVEVTIFF